MRASTAACAGGTPRTTQSRTLEAAFDRERLGVTGSSDVWRLSDVLVAHYVAKYATKSTEATGVELRQLTCRVCSGAGVITVETPDATPAGWPAVYATAPAAEPIRTDSS